MVEMGEAAAVNKDARLPGQGVVPAFGVDGGDTHQDLLDRAGRIQLDDLSWDTGDFARWYGPFGSPEEEKPPRAGRVTVKVLLGVLNALGLLFAANLSFLRLSDRLDDQVDRPEVVLLWALAAVATAIVALPVAAVAVRARWIGRGWLVMPAFVLGVALLGICTVAPDL